MSDNHDLIENNNLSKNSNGGTELMMRRLYGGDVPRKLLEQVQIIPSRFQGLDSSKKAHVLYLHDLPEDPASAKLSDPDFRSRFDKIVCVSDWQLQRYNLMRGVTYGESIVIRNAIDPFPVEVVKKSNDTIRLIYHTTPHRGLEILVPVFEHLCTIHDNIELDVFSSFNLYGWGERDKQYEELFDRIRNHPKMYYHGAVRNELIREALCQAHIFAYPSIWMETSCLCLIEAMSAGCLCVHPNYSTLPETSGGLNMMYNWNEDKNIHANVFMNCLDAAIRMEKEENTENQCLFNKQFIDAKHNWKSRAREWTCFLEAMLNGAEP